jgi:hypothetical protein
MVQASDGNFYGTTAQGGTGFNPTAGGGNGAIFRLTVPIFVSNSITLASAIAPLPYFSNLSGLAIAPQGDSLIFAKVSGPAWLEVKPRGIITGTPANTDIGTNIFVVSLTDSNGVSATATLIISVIPDPPPAFVVNPITEGWANVDEAYSGNIATNATDPELGDCDVLSFAKISGPAWLNVAADGTLSGTPTDVDAGTNIFVVSVSNLGGASNTATLWIYVNSGPSFVQHNFATPAGSVGANYSGTIATNATDADLSAGDILSFYKITGPAWLNMAPNGGLSGVPSSNNLGANTFLVLVVDSGGLADTGNLNVTVNAMAAAPITVQISQQGSNVVLSWSGGSAPYQVKTTTDLNNPVWQNLGGPAIATNLVLSPSNVSSYYQIEGQ